MSDTSLFGHNPDERLLAVEFLPKDREGNQALLFHREGNRVIQSRETFTPFLFIENEKLLQACPFQSSSRRLQGTGRLKALAMFSSWADWDGAKRWLVKKTGRNASDPDAPFFVIGDPVQQYLLLTGRTFFKGLTFDQLRRMQVDIETHSEPGFDFPNPHRKTDRIIVIAMGDNTGWHETIWDRNGNEAKILKRFVQLVQKRDPDVIEGHNIFKFDLSYIDARARLHKIALPLGRDASPLRSRPSRCLAGERIISYPRYEITGRHIIDTYLLLQAYDISHRSLQGFGLKAAAAHFGISADKRTYIEGSEIAQTFQRDPQKVLRYAHDDIKETEALSRVLSQTYFIQAQMLPFSYQTVCLRGNAAKIDALMIREYLRQHRAIPAPEWPREFEGGYTDIFEEGVISNVQHCDVRSLYPSIMLAGKLKPHSDELGVFPRLLEYLHTYRSEAKRKMQASRSPSEQTHFDSIQSTFKILINSFYGYLGFAHARFNDFKVAEQVTAEGRKILQGMLAWLKAHGAKPIEIDTDGIYFVPPGFRNAREQKAFRQVFQKTLPKGIEVEFDGEYRSMFSYKMKNYALLDWKGEMIIRGAALKSRGIEPYLRAFVHDYLRLKLESKDRKIPGLKARYEKAIANGTLPIQQLAKTETLKDAPQTYAVKIQQKGRGRNAAYELALHSKRNYQAGDQLSYYITGTKKSVSAYRVARLVSDWNPRQRDENINYYLAKLQALYERFEGGCGPKSGEDADSK